jgi:hypothetical protein
MAYFAFGVYDEDVLIYDSNRSIWSGISLTVAKASTERVVMLWKQCSDFLKAWDLVHSAVHVNDFSLKGTIDIIRTDDHGTLRKLEVTLYKVVQIVPCVVGLCNEPSWEVHDFIAILLDKLE